MKDKSRILSSVIVSLLAGFIYYQSGSDIQQKIEKSFKAVLSRAETEVYGPENSQPFTELLKKSGSKVKKNKNHFYYSPGKTTRSNFEKDKDKTHVNLSSDLKAVQSVGKRALPDKNVDFTVELNSLIKKNTADKTDSEINVKIFRNVNPSSVADLKADERKVHKYINRKTVKQFYQKADEESSINGFGFEYNNVLGRNEVNTNKFDCSSDGNVYENNYNGKDLKEKCNTGDKKVKTFYYKKKKYIKGDNSEINLEDSELDEESM